MGFDTKSIERTVAKALKAEAKKTNTPVSTLVNELLAKSLSVESNSELIKIVMQNFNAFLKSKKTMSSKILKGLELKDRSGELVNTGTLNLHFTKSNNKAATVSVVLRVVITDHILEIYARSETKSQEVQDFLNNLVTFSTNPSVTFYKHSRFSAIGMVSRAFNNIDNITSAEIHAILIEIVRLIENYLV